MADAMRDESLEVKTWECTQEETQANDNENSNQITEVIQNLRFSLKS